MAEPFFAGQGRPLVRGASTPGAKPAFAGQGKPLSAVSPRPAPPPASPLAALAIAPAPAPAASQLAPAAPPTSAASQAGGGLGAVADPLNIPPPSAPRPVATAPAVPAPAPKPVASTAQPLAVGQVGGGLGAVTDPSSIPPPSAKPRPPLVAPGSPSVSAGAEVPHDYVKAAQIGKLENIGGAKIGTWATQTLIPNVLKAMADGFGPDQLGIDINSRDGQMLKKWGIIHDDGVHAPWWSTEAVVRNAAIAIDAFNRIFSGTLAGAQAGTAEVLMKAGVDKATAERIANDTEGMIENQIYGGGNSVHPHAQHIGSLDPLFAELGLKPDATPAQIEAAYVAKSSTLHSGNLVPGDEEAFARAAAAYHILKDPTLRSVIVNGASGEAGAPLPGGRPVAEPHAAGGEELPPTPPQGERAPGAPGGVQGAGGEARVSPPPAASAPDAATQLRQKLQGRPTATAQPAIPGEPIAPAPDGQHTSAPEAVAPKAAGATTPKSPAPARTDVENLDFSEMPPHAAEAAHAVIRDLTTSPHLLSSDWDYLHQQAPWLQEITNATHQGPSDNAGARGGTSAEGSQGTKADLAVQGRAGVPQGDRTGEHAATVAEGTGVTRDSTVQNGPEPKSDRGSVEPSAASAKDGEPQAAQNDNAVGTAPNPADLKKPFVGPQALPEVRLQYEAQHDHHAHAHFAPNVDAVEIKEPSTKVVKQSLALDDVAHALKQPFEVNREHNVRYGAGSSEDGKRVYIDPQLPKTLKINGVQFDPAIPITIHERVEKALLDHGYTYEKAHPIALAVEHAWVRENIGAKGDSGDPYHVVAPYEEALVGWLKHSETEPPVNEPGDLELKPYLKHPADLAAVEKGEGKAPNESLPAKEPGTNARQDTGNGGRTENAPEGPAKGKTIPEKGVADRGIAEPPAGHEAGRGGTQPAVTAKPKALNEYGHYEGQRVEVRSNNGDRQYVGVVKAVDKQGRVSVLKDGASQPYLVANPLFVVDVNEANGHKPAPIEHPGLVIKSLETGKTTEIQPEGTVPPKVKTPQVDALPGMTPLGAKPKAEVTPNIDALKTYGKSVINDTVQAVHLVGSTAAKGRGNDIDLLYDLAPRHLPNDPVRAAEVVTRILESKVNHNLDLSGAYDSHFRVGDRYFHHASGAGSEIVENTEYGRQQAGKPLTNLAGKAAEAPTKQGWTEIGKNDIGQTLYEDHRGVRSYIENGVRRTEPVPVRPTRQGGVETVTPEHKNEYQLASEAKGEKQPAEAAAPKRTPEDWWTHGLTKYGREEALKAAGIPTKHALTNWEHLPPKVREMVSEIKGTGSDPLNQPAEPPAASRTPQVALAHSIKEHLAGNEPLTMKALLQHANKAYGGTLAEGRFDRKDVYDAMELAVNMQVRDDPGLRITGDWRQPVEKLKAILDRLPTQTVRSEEQIRFQQFSTPPHYAAAVAYAANIRHGDTVLEPSAGTGSIVAATMQPGVKVIANELAPQREAMLRELIGKQGEVFHENAEQIDNILPERVKPTVVVMNPPFSQTAGRMGDKKVIETGAVHIEQALKRLQPGGRLVAIVGRGMSMDAPRFKQWWQRISREYTVRGNIAVDGPVYSKYGTSFGTRVLVFDKVAPTGEAPISLEAHSVPELMQALEQIRNARPAGERQPAQPSGVEATQGSAGGRAAGQPIRPEPSVVGDGQPGGRGVAGERPVGGTDAGGQPPRVEAGERAPLAPVESERPVGAGAGAEPDKGNADGKQPATSGDVHPEPNILSSAKSEPSSTASGERIALDHAEPGAQSTAEITDSLYEAYQPQRVRIAGAKPHPGPLVQSAAMASVEPPTPTYEPAFAKSTIEKGHLSLAQLEAVVYTGQAHQKMLPAAEGEIARRRGHFIGDGTGVGKGREIAGITLDNWRQGRTKHVWVSEKKTLLQDAKRDWSGLAQDENHLFDVGKTKAGEPIQAGKGIAFVTYDTLKGGMSDQAALAKGGFIRKQEVTVGGKAAVVQSVGKARGKEPAQVKVKFSNGDEATFPANEVEALNKEGSVKTRVDQLVDWFGKDYDGVIAFDEAHNMGNATSVKGDRGVKEAAQKALAGMLLQERLPNARVVYVSATGATEVSNLAYADRLGLWGRGTPFAGRNEFINQVESGGIAAMELIARDMKQLGLYTARNLSYDGVEYGRVEHTLSAPQREIYDTLAEAWQNVLRNINKALEMTGGNENRNAKSAAMSAFWGTHQRFFNQIITSMQMPSVVKAVERDLAEGRQAVLQLTNTNEASQERAAAKATTAEEIEDLDITPRDSIIQLVEKSFPTQQYETYVTEDGSERNRPVVDAEGKPVENREAVAMREKLVEQLASVRVPQGPLDLILDHFGTENVAEVTGRGRRFVMKRDDSGQMRRVEEARPSSANLAETEAFQGGKKRILVFSEAGGTGRSYHADNTAASKDARRAHYLVQAGWRADKAVQGFGRTHRTNQASAPIFNLVTTDLKGQKRFISSIARRLAQLGALTKGARAAGDQGVFSARDNLESHEAQMALQQVYMDLLAGRVEGVSVDQFEEQTGLSLRIKGPEGEILGIKQEFPPITQFLNRLLSLKINMQNTVFDAFASRMDGVIEARKAAGLLDTGLETVRADKIVKKEEQVVHTNEESGAPTKHVQLELSNRFRPTSFDQADKSFGDETKMYVKSPQGRVYIVQKGPDHTDAKTGDITAQYRLVSPVSPSRLIEADNIDRRGSPWSKIERKPAQDLWADETAKAPEFVKHDLHLITGAILPIWDRLGGSPRVVRLQTNSGERLIGRVVPESLISTTLKALGADFQEQKVDTGTLFSRLLDGARAKLANGWSLQKALVAGEDRIELKGPSSFSEGEQVKVDGVFTERIQYTTRYFVPTDPEAGAAVLKKLTEFRPVIELDAPQRRVDQRLGSTVAKATNNEAPRVKLDPRQRANLETALRAKVAELIGPERAKNVTLEHTIPVKGAGDAAYNSAMEKYQASGGQMGETAGGAVRIMPSGEAFIRLATDDPKFDAMGSARHEPYHVAEAVLMTDKEFAAVNAPENMAKLREHAAHELGIDPAKAEALPHYEARAIAYERYDRLRDEGFSPAEAALGTAGGLHGTLARFFERVRALVARIRNMLTGKGYTRYQDIFEAVHRGDMANREARQPVRDLTHGGDMALANAADHAEPLTELGNRVQRDEEKTRAFTQRRRLDHIGKIMDAHAEEISRRAKDAVKYLNDNGIKGKAAIAAVNEKVIHYRENTSNPSARPKLSSAELSYYRDHVEPLADLHRRLYVEIQGHLKDLTPEEQARFADMLSPDYVPHVVIGKGSAYDRLAQQEGGSPILGGRRLQVSTSAMKTPSYHVIENDRTGQRIVVSKGEKGLTRWQNGKAITGRGSFPDINLREGVTFKSKAADAAHGGDTWTVKRAKLAEKRTHTPTKYYGNAFAQFADSLLQLQRVKLSLEHFDELTHTPEWSRMASPITSPKPEGWVQIDAPGLRSYYLHPRLAAPYLDYLKGGDPVLKFGQTFESFNKIAIGSLFVSPFPHVWNVAAHWLVSRGWDWANPVGYTRGAIAGIRAYKSIHTLDDRYLGWLRDGAPLLYAHAKNTRVIEHLFNMMGQDIEKDAGGKWSALAKASGYDSAAHMAKAYYSAVNKSMWYMGDWFMLARLEEMVARGYSRAEAIARVRKAIPDYVVMPEVLGSRLLSRMIQDSNMTNFGRYRYGQIGAILHDLKDVFDPRGGPQLYDRGAAIGRLVMLGVAVTFVKPAIDQLLQSITGDPNMKLRNPGALSIVQDAIDLQHGKASPWQTIQKVWGPSPGIELGYGTVTNHQMFTQDWDRQPNKYGDKASTIRKNEHSTVGKILDQAEFAIGTTGLGQLIEQGFKKGPGSVFQSQVLGASSPSEKSVFYNAYDDVKGAPAGTPLAKLAAAFKGYSKQLRDLEKQKQGATPARVKAIEAAQASIEARAMAAYDAASTGRSAPPPSYAPSAPSQSFDQMIQ